MSNGIDIQTKTNLHIHEVTKQKQICGHFRMIHLQLSVLTFQ